MSVRQIAIPTGSHESKRNAPKTRAQRRALSSQAARQTNHLHLPDTEHDTVAPMSIRVPTTSLSFVLPVDPLDLFSLIHTLPVAELHVRDRTGSLALFHSCHGRALPRV